MRAPPLDRPPDTMTDAVPITIVGGGFSGTSTAIQMLRRSRVPLAVTLVEPRAVVGPGLAYTSRDPDHRLNAPTASHAVDPVDPGHLMRWCLAEGLFERDPQAMTGGGPAFIRRGDYGRYLAASLRQLADEPPAGCRVELVRARAIHASVGHDTYVTTTDTGRTLTSAMLIVATGNPPPRLPSSFDPALRGHPSLVAQPLQDGALAGIDRQARVLVVGSSLTALDVISTLVRGGHSGGIVVVSRRGLRPRPQSPALDATAAAGDPAAALRPLDRILAPLPDFLSPGRSAPTTAGWLRSVRARIREREADGQSWHIAFDEARDVVWRLWPLLPPAQQRRFLRSLRPWYDVHRFRAPPQNDALVRGAEAEGRVEFRAARLHSVVGVPGGALLRARLRERGEAADRDEVFGAVVNCTGLELGAGVTDEPFLSSLLAQGRLRMDGPGIGLSVDANCRAFDARGEAQARLRVVGPPTAGTFGDPLGAVYIAAQIHRMLPDALATLADAAASARAPA